MNTPSQLLLCSVLVLLLSSINVYSQYDVDKYSDVYKRYLTATCPLQQDSIQHFVYFIKNRELIKDHPFLITDKFRGAQIMYSWKQLEPEMNTYDFSIIEADLTYLELHQKKLFIQLQDATFVPTNKGVPDYLLTQEYNGGVAPQSTNGEIEGWVSKRWNKKVQERFALLILELGKHFNGRIEGINLQETAIEVNAETDSTFNELQYVNGIKANMLALKQAFPSSVTMQYANFMPGEWLPWDDKGYLRSIYKFGEDIGVGLGGPDLIMQKRGQLNHILRLMHEGTFSVPLGIAVQDGNYIGTTNDLSTKSQRENLVPVLHGFAAHFLKVDYMFWVYQEPYFTEDLLPCFLNE